MPVCPFFQSHLLLRRTTPADTALWQNSLRAALAASYSPKSSSPSWPRARTAMGALLRGAKATPYRAFLDKRSKLHPGLEASPRSEIHQSSPVTEFRRRLARKASTFSLRSKGKKNPTLAPNTPCPPSPAPSPNRCPDQKALAVDGMSATEPTPAAITRATQDVGAAAPPPVPFTHLKEITNNVRL